MGERCRLAATGSPLTYARNRHVHEVGMLVILCGRVISLQSLKELPENLLRDLTPSSFQIGETRQAEGCIEIMRHRIERPTQRQGIRIPLELELSHSQGVLCPRGALQIRHLAQTIHYRYRQECRLSVGKESNRFYAFAGTASYNEPRQCPMSDNNPR